ncbi:MAG: acyl carrier protein [Negativicutes bacterium]
MSTFDQVRTIVAEQLTIKADDITMESTFIDDLGADSLDIVELMMAFEEKFEIELPDDEAEKIKAIKDAVKLIDEKKA